MAESNDGFFLAEKDLNLRGPGEFLGTRQSGYLPACACLFARFETKLEEFRGNLARAGIELAKDWRTEKSLRQLDALLVVANTETSLLISGTGDVVEPDDGIVAIGSGGSFALAAARMLVKHTDLPARRIVEESLAAAADICVYTNSHLTIEEL